MECNKEEAMRAKDIAEKKMQSRDFSGARKLALKAQQLFPDLENISQMLTVCDVHCSAAVKVNGVENWCEILQVEPTADESFIKKHYQKLALLLHPGKNKFAGAEAAFKLIGEAHRTLSDPMKRSLYDLKIRSSFRYAMPKQQPQQSNRTHPAKKPPRVKDNLYNHANMQFTGFNQQSRDRQQQTQVGAQTFWTQCPCCKMKYQYHRSVLNNVLRCQSCQMPFITREISLQKFPAGANSGSSGNQSSIPQQHKFPGRGVFDASRKSNSGNSSCGTGFQGNVGGGPTVFESSSKSAMDVKLCSVLKYKGKGENKADKEAGKVHDLKFERVMLGKSKGKKQAVKSTASPSWKRGRKMAIESNESDDSDFGSAPKRLRKGGSSHHTDRRGSAFSGGDANEVRIPVNENDKKEDRSNVSTCLQEKLPTRDESESTVSEEVIIEEADHSAGQNTGTASNRYPRRSTWLKQNVTYNENGSDDDVFGCTPRMLRKGGSSHDNDWRDSAFSGGDANEVRIPANENDKKEDKSNLNTSFEENLPTRDEQVEESKGNLEENLPNGASLKADPTVSTPNAEEFSYPDPEFWDFGKDKNVSKFKVGQIWAIYDNLDGMPRFYALIRNISSPEFMLRFTWLENYAVSKNEKDWSDVDLPIACGNFKLGRSEKTQDLPKFSHVMCCRQDTKRKTYEIYPRAGEVWAIFKGWDINWNSDPDNHRQYGYEIVEVLTDYAKGIGVSVIHLVRVRGFVSLFCKAVNEGIVPVHIEPNKMLIFSHMVPAYRLTGEEREGVPKGSYELDAGSLPPNFQESFPSLSLDEIYVRAAETDVKNHGQCSEFVAGVEKPANEGVTSKTSKKSRELNEENIHSELHVTSRNLAKGVNGAHIRNCNKLSASQSAAVDAEKNAGVERMTPKCQVDKDDKVFARPYSSHGSDAEYHDDSLPASTDPMVYEFPDAEFYSFESERSRQSFQTGQIWAHYSDIDGFPKYYAVINKVDFANFKVHVTWLEACPELEEEIQWSEEDLPISCGKFKVQSRRKSVQVYETTETFSHLVLAEATEKKQQYDIYPHVGEVWAVYRNWNIGWKSSNLENCEFDLVEVLANANFVIKVMVLTKVDGFKAVFKPERKAGIEVMITRKELLKFSHQIPAFRLTKERGGKLQGCWKLDTASVPVFADPMVYEYTDSEFYSFESERTRVSFQTGQIWALYNVIDCFPNDYVVINKVDLAKFKVHVTWLEACPELEEEIRWSEEYLPISCGRFKVQSGKKAMQVYETTETFSHLVLAEATEKKQRYDIYPHVGEVWAVYRNWNVGWKSSNLENYEYDLVEVLANANFVIKVMVLTKVDGFKAVFRPERNTGIEVTITRKELLKFSHQIPAFRLTKERGGKLQGCWELDTASVPASEDPMVYEYPDSEFYSFESERSRQSFQTGQIWALYNVIDCFPNNYAVINKIDLAKFRVHVTWLEAFPELEEEIRWSEEYLPISCGRFKVQSGKKSMLVYEPTMAFSHLVLAEATGKKKWYDIYPHVGDVWAVYRNWNVGWKSSNLENCEYDLVEVLANVNFVIKVMVLTKVDGFRAVFRLERKKGIEVMITRKELLKFSHQIPAFRLTEERNGKLRGCWELDVASVPEVFLCTSSWESHLKNAGVEQMAPKCQADKDHKVFGSPDSSSRGDAEHHADSLPASADPMVYEYPDPEFYSFESERSHQSFQTAQIWALYCDIDGFPKYYAMINKVDLANFKVHVTWLEACPELEEEIRWSGEDLPISCGRFKVQSGKKSMHIYETTEAFSHLVLAEATRKKQWYDIYPHVGEVWALYKNWNAGWKLSNLKNCEYDFVEVLVNADSVIKVTVLTKVNCFKAVFRPEKKAGIEVTMDITWKELLKFSHQIPAFRLTEERGGKLEGCWELDTASVPEVFLCASS